MSEQMPQASEQQIVDTVMSIHHEAAEAVKGEIDTRKIAVGAVTQNIWSMDIGHGGHLSFEERHINVRLPTDAPVQDSYFTKLPIYVDLPDERQGDFTIVV